MAGRGKIIKTDIAGKLSFLECKIKQNESLADHTSIGIGGKADLFAEVYTKQQLSDTVKFLKAENIKMFVIGGGTNILFSDAGFNGAVIKLCGDFCNIKFTGDSVFCGSGASLSYLSKQAIDKGLGGLEFFASIPGTVGGAVFGNAGIKDRDISSVITDVEVMDYSGSFTVLKAENIQFGYRKSGLKDVIVTGAGFTLKKADKNDMLKTVSEELIKRKSSQPAGTRNAGCVFKNPKDISAGKLIDSLGLKGYAAGDAEISSVHANFFINKGNATSEDMCFLIDMVKNKVREKFNIDLETEIKIIK